jgi:RNA polymerase sigma-70 factor (ECF subfamily)
LASDKELSDFLASVEKRAYKRSLFHVRNEEAALDIVQDSMMKLVEYYAPKPAQELPMLFQRILSNTTLDWFRRQKTRNALFTNYNDFGSEDDSQSTDFLEKTGSDTYNPVTESAQDLFSRTETVREI